MNILFLTNKSAYSQSSFGGAESSMRLLATELAKRNHTVVYVTQAPTAPLSFPVQYDRIKGVHVYSLWGSLWLLPGRRILRRAFSRLVEKCLMRLIRSYDIQMVYCYYELQNVQMLLRIRERSGSFKVVMRMAGMRWCEDCKSTPGLSDAYEHVFNEVDGINFIHPYLKEMIEKEAHQLQIDCHFNRTFVGDIGTSVPFDRLGSYDPVDDDRVSMIMATRFSDYQKRQDLLVRAIKKIDQHDYIDLKLIGEGSKKEHIRRMVERLNLKDSINFSPFLPQEKLWSLMSDADLLCHACEYEGLSKIIIESMALGLPVLASDVPVINRYITDGQNGFLVRNSPEAWANKIVQLAQDKAGLARVSERSVKFIKDRYDPAVNVSAYEEYFRRVVEADT